MTAADTSTGGRLLGEDELRHHVEWLAALERGTGSPGERAAGERIAAELDAAGHAVRRDAERVHGTYWWPIGLATGAAAVAGAAAGRLTAAVVGATAALAAADDVTAGPRRLRRLLPARETVNVWCAVGPEDAPRTVAIVAHHDAAHSGLVFEPRTPRAILARLPGRVRDRITTTPPTMWGAVGGPALVALGALTGSRAIRRAGVLVSAGYVAAMADIGARAVVPGANDNASGVAAGLSLGAWLAAGPPDGVRVVLVFPGAEESFMEGMGAWCDRHLAAFDPATTSFVCLDTVGSPSLVALEAEGMLRLHEYPRDLLELVHAVAAELGIAVHRGLRFRNATDGLIPLKRGYRAAMLGSVDEYLLPPDYHWPTDTADRVRYDTVADTARLCRRLIERIAAGALDPA